MPCKDLTEIIEIDLNQKDQIIDYYLTKKTCGKTLGNPKLILPYLKNKSAKKILETSLENFLKKHKSKNSILLHEFLHSKHFSSVKTGLELIFGEQQANKDFYIKKIISNEKGLHFEGEIKVTASTKNIKSCCGNKTKT